LFDRPKPKAGCSANGRRRRRRRRRRMMMMMMMMITIIIIMKALAIWFHKDNLIIKATIAMSLLRPLVSRKHFYDTRFYQFVNKLLVH
jgi:hypothetical protein